MHTPFTFHWTKRHEEFCLDNKIYLKHVQQTKNIYAKRNLWLLQPGKKIRIECQIIAEKYSTMPINGFCSSGAFSYCASPFPNDVNIGRYCSIAPRVNLMGTQHPLDRFTSSPLTYHPRFAEIALRDFGVNYEQLDYEMKTSSTNHWK